MNLTKMMDIVTILEILDFFLMGPYALQNNDK